DGDDELSCSFNPGDGNSPEPAACTPNTYQYHTYIYSEAGQYPVELTVTDEHGQQATRGYLLDVITPPQSIINSFTATEPVIAGQPMRFTWDVTYALPDELDCHILIKHGSVLLLPNCRSGELEHTFSTPGEVTATLRIHDDLLRVTEEDLNLSVLSEPTIDITIDPPFLTPEVVITGPDGYAATITINDNEQLTLPGPGEYQLTPQHIEENITLHHANGSEIPAIRDREPETTTITHNATSGDVTSLTLTYEERTQPVTFNLYSLHPNDETDLNNELLYYPVIIEVPDENDPGYWRPAFKDIGTGTLSLQPGVYRYYLELIQVSPDDEDYTKVYSPIITWVPYVITRATSTTETINIGYNLLLGTLDVTLEGAPAGTNPEPVLEEATPPYFEAPHALDNIPPGKYRIRGESISVNETFTDGHGNTESADVRYETKPAPISVSSGINPPVTVTYEPVDGLFRVHINGPKSNPNEEEIIGNVVFTRLDGDERTFTLTEQTQASSTVNYSHAEQHPPGMYRVEIKPVPPVEGVHNGYTPEDGEEIRYYALPSRLPSSNGNDVTVTVNYVPND
ncbi:MAG TPA: hypothetical protein VK054_01920, partial [Beutenbergiaceae bacterium]|nr:hypothetical protein [Beutenbergiaceae bacterium]